MAFRCKCIVFTFVIVSLATCKVDVTDTFPNVTASKPVDIQITRSFNTMGSEFLNWDSLLFTFSSFESDNNYSNCNPVFLSNAAVPDTLILRFNRLPYENAGIHYCGLKSCEAYMNKLSNIKIKSYGSGKIAYQQISDDSAELSFNMEQSTNYRLPDNSNLKAQINGKFKMPHVKLKLRN